MSTDLPQSRPLLLASASAARLQMLQAAGLNVTAHPARVDEDAMRAALLAEDASPHDQADALAEIKACKIADRFPQELVLGCDQILALKRQVFAKPSTPDDARAQLRALRGQTHQLISAAVLYDGAQPIWRHATTARLTMRDFSDSFLDAYLSRTWPAISTSVGGYQIESEGIRLFASIEGDHFTILGLPLLPLLSYLCTRGWISS